jgi:DNA repair protein RecN (Recombination protein N)
MLKELQVKNFAIIDDVKIKFGKGLNVLSGETGAGKTLVIEAINLLIGERADSELIREGREKLLVQGFFDFSNNNKVKNFLISNKLVDNEDFNTEIVISRELNRNGNNKAFINGLFTKVSILKDLGYCFLDIHGQHDHQYLLEPRTHIDIVDSYGKDSIYPLKEEYLKCYHLYNDTKKKVENLENMQNNREARLNDLRYRYQEIEKLNIYEGEEQELENELRILKNFESIYSITSETEEAIKGSDIDSSNLSDSVSKIQKNLEILAEMDNRFTNFSKRMAFLTDLIEELSHFLKSYLSDLDFSKERLDAIQERLYSFSLIKKKYNIEISDTGKYLKELESEIDSYESLDKDIETAKEELMSAIEELSGSSVRLSNKRLEISKKLEEKIIDELENLGFKSALFKIKNNLPEIDKVQNGEIIKQKFKLNGIDEIEFFISLNEGESPRALKKIASGGEISRIMLALKSAMGNADNISTMIFDEIDSGIGGEASFVVGEKLFNLSLNKQIIVISHLAQIACFSAAHYLIEKYVLKGRTKIKINKLDSEGKIKEISRMLSGMKESEISQKHSEELIKKADIIKNNLIEETSGIGN